MPLYGPRQTDTVSVKQPGRPSQSLHQEMLMSFVRDLSFSAAVAGLVTVLVGYTSTAVIVLAAASALGASAEQSASWMWALGLGMGLPTVLLSLRYRQPVMIAWSTPGAALLVTSVSGISMAEAIGAFMISAALIAFAGFSGWFEKLMNRIPTAIASAMLAGVLLRFGLDAFASLKADPLLIGVMLLTYVVARRWLARYAIPLVMTAGVLVAAAGGQINFGDISWSLTLPVWTTPAWSLQALLSVAIPLFLVTMASQNAPGVATIRAFGLSTPVSPIIGISGVTTFVLAPFGAYALNLAAITAAICMGPQAHPQLERRYAASVTAGSLYILVGLFGATVATLFAAFPQPLVLALAGFALVNTIGNGLAGALTGEAHREAAALTFLITASGVTLAGIGAAFWGLLIGSIAYAILTRR
ncbi:benzoate/H(+) symporter BenE family transporter [Chitinibacteraceae bacterium HSL-7]